MSPQSLEKSDSEAKPRDSQDKPAAGGVSGARLNDRFDIWPSMRLADLDVPGATAFGASDSATNNDRLFALVCDGKIVPRTDIMNKLRDSYCEELLRLVDWGTAPWLVNPESGPGPSRLMVIYERPAGERLVSDLSAVSPPMSEYDVLRHVLMPGLKGLSHLSTQSVTHRGIRPTNLFYSDSTRKSIIFGDCVTTPPAYAQPALFESLESAMANPAGRGPGGQRDDVYALGVTLLFLLLGRHPVPELDDEALLAARLANGSFATLVGKTPIPASLSEPLRGMLNDDPKRRWDVQDLEKWLIDRDRRPTTMHQVQKADRPFKYEGRDYYNCRSLAHEIARNWRSPNMADRKKELITWIERCIGDIARRDVVEHAYEQPSVGAGAGAAILNARLAIALDPTAPLRYKSFAAAMDGIGPMLTACVGDSVKTQEIAEMVRAGLPNDWLIFRRPDEKDLGGLVGTFRRLGDHIKNPRPGAGIERCLYELNVGQHCLSPLIEHDHVVTIAQLLPALERNAPREGPPFDRHIAAFIADRLGSDMTAPLDLATNHNPVRAAIGLLALYATLQRKLGPASLPGLTRWIGSCCQPIIASYHNRLVRKHIEIETPNVIKSGSLPALQKFLVLSDQRQADEAGFAAAIERHAKTESEIVFLQSGGASDPARTQFYGRRLAAAFSAAVSALIIIVVTVVKL